MSTLPHMTTNPRVENASTSETATGGAAGANLYPKDSTSAADLGTTESKVGMTSNQGESISGGQPGSAEAAAEKLYEERIEEEYAKREGASKASPPSSHPWQADSKHMPAFRVPRSSGAHRIAAIALYRALLSQCRALTAVEAQQRDELQNIVRNRFRQSRFEHSTRRLTLSFEAGYEAIDHLDAAVAGDEASRSYVLDLLARAPQKVKQTPPNHLSKDLLAQVTKQLNQSPDKEGISKPSLFDRPLPLPQLSGPRHVPILFNAQGIPVLRIKKPQPENLSGYLNHRLQKKQHRHDMRHRLEDELALARMEDQWDRIVAEEQRREGDGSGERVGLGRGGSGGWHGREDTWSYEVVMARNEVNEKLNEERRQNQAWGERMQGVVDREQALDDEEQAEPSRDNA